MNASRSGGIRAALFLAAMCIASSASAQGTPQLGGQYLATRATLEAQAKTAESLKQATAAALLRQRLRDGDFQEGDRIWLSFDTGPAGVVSETLTVRASRKIEIPHYGEIPLQGILHAELVDVASTHLRKEFNEPAVRAIALIRLQVQGAVGRPGTLYAPPDSPISDVIMFGGGQAAEANPNEIVVRRAGVVIWKASDLRQAIAGGYSVDRLQMRGGDEIYVPRKAQHNWLAWTQFGLSIVTLLFFTLK